MNMSYCRWQNTAQDMADCVESIEDLMEGDDSDNSFQSMSSHEQSGVLSCARQAVEMLANLPPEILAAAGVDLSILPTPDDIAGCNSIARRAA